MDPDAAAGRSEMHERSRRIADRADPHTEEALRALAAQPASSSFVAGGDWILDAPDTVPAVWGDEESGRVLWAEGEPFMVAGPPGVGKTTLMTNVLLARCGIGTRVLDLDVRPTSSKVLLIAADRPKQASRAMKRSTRPEHRELLNERLVVRQGPPPRDFAKHPDTLLIMCQEAGADTVIIDSLKDVAIGISADDVGAGLNASIQLAIAAGIEVAVLHHQRKGQNGEKPKTLADVYGSTWITAGMGSVALLWGAAGDPLVELIHLKQPSHPVGPLTIEHNHETGHSTVNRGQVDPLVTLRKRPNGLTAPELALLMANGTTPTESDEKKARRTLDRLETGGHAHKTPATKGGPGGSQPARYHAIDKHLEATS